VEAVLDGLDATPAGFCEEVARMDQWDRMVTRLPGEHRTARWPVRQAMHEGQHHLDDIRWTTSASLAPDVLHLADPTVDERDASVTLQGVVVDHLPARIRSCPSSTSPCDAAGSSWLPPPTRSRNHRPLFGTGVSSEVADVTVLRLPARRCRR